jgi:hypothetical protein
MDWTQIMSALSRFGAGSDSGAQTQGIDWNNLSGLLGRMGQAVSKGSSGEWLGNAGGVMGDYAKNKQAGVLNSEAWDKLVASMSNPNLQTGALSMKPDGSFTLKHESPSLVDQILAQQQTSPTQSALAMPVPGQVGVGAMGGTSPLAAQALGGYQSPFERAL